MMVRGKNKNDIVSGTMTLLWLLSPVGLLFSLLQTECSRVACNGRASGLPTVQTNILTNVRTYTHARTHTILESSPAQVPLPNTSLTPYTAWVCSPGAASQKRGIKKCNDW